eukprot:3879822-Alexandrium_andersonii.AAC.1
MLPGGAATRWALSSSRISLQRSRSGRGEPSAGRGHSRGHVSVSLRSFPPFRDMRMGQEPRRA